MIYRLRYCNKDGVEARVDIQKGSSTPVIEVEGTERPFVLSYNNDKGNKSGMFLSSSADIEIYETTDFNIDNLKTSNETELSVTHYINNIVSWQGFIIPDFFSIEVRNNPVITMTASDRLGTLKSVTLSDLPSMVNIRELAVLCLNKTGLTLPLKTMADFSNDDTDNAFFSYYIDSQRIKDVKGRSISCYNILSSILIVSRSKLVQRAGEWVIINKLQHEIGRGKLYSDTDTFTNYLESIHNFEQVSVGARRTIMPVAGSAGIYHEHGGRKSHPENYDYSLGLLGWNSMNGFTATIENRHIAGFLGGTPLFDTERTVKQYLLNYNDWIDDTNNLNTAPYISTDPIQINSPRADRVEVTVDISSTMAEKLSSNTAISFLRYAVILTNGVKTYTLTKAGIFEILDPENISGHSLLLRGGQQPPLLLASPAFSNSDSFKGLFEVGEDDDVNDYSASIRVYGSGNQYVTVNYALIKFSDVSELPKGTMYKTEQGEVFTKAYDIETSIFGDYLLSGLDGYFYRYPNDDTSSIYKDVNTLSTPVWTTPSIPDETSELPLLHHSMRQMRRMFSVAHDLLSAEIEVSDFDPLSIFVSCDKRYTVVSAKFDFFKSNLSVELEEVAFKNNVIREFIYSYFGDGDSGIKSIGGISGGGGGGSTGGGLTPEQIEILSFWKKDPDRENTIFTEMNAYSKMELSAYGAGDGGGGGGSDYERLDTWADYDSSKAGWVLSAFLGNDLNTRVTAIDDRVTDLENSAGGGSVTSVGISVPTGLSVSNSPITSSGVIAIGLQTGYSIPTTAKQGQWDTAYSNTHTHSNKAVLDGITSVLVGNWNTAFTNNHTHSNKTVLDGITSALVSNWNTAYTNNHTHSNKTVIDGITSVLVGNWNTAFTNNHTHSNKAQLDLITQSNIDVLAKLSIVNGNLQINGNAYATGELSAYGAGDGGGSGGGIIETVYGYGNLGQTFNNNVLTDTFNAYTINQINTRLVSVENGSATTVNTTGTGNAITSLTKSGTVITATKGATFSLSNHLHTGVYEPVFTKNSAFNKNFGTTAGTVAQGNDSRIINGQTAYSWGNHASAGYVPSTRTITAGNGLSGGGTLAADRTITLGTPSNITLSTTNSVTTASHTHNFAPGGTASQYINGAASLITIPTITAGTGLTGGGQLTASRTLSLDTSYADNRYLQRSGGSMTNTNLVTNMNAEYIGGVSLSNLARGGYTSYSSGTTSGWKRVLVINGTSSAGGQVSGSLTIGKSYSYGINETYHINFNATYGSNATEFNNKADIVKVSGADGTQITKVRLVAAVNVSTITPSVAVDVYYQAPSEGSNTMYVQFWGGNASIGTLLTPWEDAPATISSPYISKEINITRRGYAGDLVTANTFYGALTGNATTATKLQTARTIWGQSFDGTGNVSGAITSNYWHLNDNSNNPFLRLTRAGQNWYVQAVTAGLALGAGMSNSMLITNTGDVGIGTTTPSQKLDVVGNIKASGAVTAPTFIGALTGNATTATKLQTARTIWGQSFDGTGNVSGNISNTGNITPSTTASSNIGTSSLMYERAYIRNIDTQSGYFLRFNVAGSEYMTINISGNVGIGTTSPSEKLHVVGNILATGTTTTTKVIFNAAGWSMEQVGSELQMKHNNVLKMRFTSTGSIVATEEITAFG